MILGEIAWKTGLKRFGGLARADRKRRQWLGEMSFARGAKLHGMKRARWRRVWRQSIQDWLIATVQNLKMLASHRWQPA